MNRSAGKPVGGRLAFSLLEVVLVLLILATLSMLAVPRYAASLNYYRADLASKRIAADLAMARNNAWASGTRRTATFDVGGSSYVLAGIRGLDRATADYAVGLSGDPYYAQILSVSFEGQSSVTFDGYGMPDRGGQIVVRVGSVQKTVVLDRNSGNVSVQ